MNNLKRPRLNMDILNNDYKEIIKSLKKNRLFVCQLEDGVLVMIEKQDNNLKSIMVNPHNYKIKGVTTWAMDFDGLKNMHDEVFNDNENKFYSIEKGRVKIEDLFVSLVDALTCLKFGDGNGYRLRKVDKEENLIVQ